MHRAESEKCRATLALLPDLPLLRPPPGAQDIPLRIPLLGNLDTASLKRMLMRCAMLFINRALRCPACPNLNPRRMPLNFNRITINSNQMNGMPCLRSLRIPVTTVVGMLADGMSETEILSAYPDLEKEDIIEALRYAAEAVRERELPLIKVA